MKSIQPSAPPAKCGHRPIVFIAALFMLIGLLTACAPPPLSFGNFGGPARQIQPSPPGAEAGEIVGAEHAVRWYPHSARFSPDETHLLVGLCHFKWSYCRIARYWLAEQRWEVLPTERGTSRAWPEYSPDGQHIVFVQANCPNTHECKGHEHALHRMRADGSEAQALGARNVIMPAPSPDGRRVLYWRLNGSVPLSGGRSLSTWDIYETEVSTGLERRITDESYYGVYSAARYVPGSDQIFYSAYHGDGRGGYFHVIPISDGIRKKPDGGWLPALKPWGLVQSGYMHAYHPSRGWLVSASALWLESFQGGSKRNFLVNANPFYIGISDINLSGSQVVAVTVDSSTKSITSATDYWRLRKYPSVLHIPVMVLVDLENYNQTVIANWPADVEIIRQRNSSP